MDRRERSTSRPKMVVVVVVAVVNTAALVAPVA